MPRISRFLHVSTVAIGLIVPAIHAQNAQTDKPLLENDRVRVTRVDLPKGEFLPDDNRFDAITVKLQAGETALTEPGKMEKTDKSSLDDSHYFIAGSQRRVKNLEKNTLPFVEIQFLQPQGKYAPIDVPESHYCNPGSTKKCVTERYLFCTDRFCAETVTLEPGAVSTQHTHDADYMVVATSDFSWSNEPVGKPAVQEKFKIGDVRYIDAGGTHRLVNNGGTTVRLFVVQFK
ncbi:MAG TPA: hypothetical protein VG897_18955 [Terriglobales bacterium]|nr:hypothetical protein [Terriglobales bacterium]